MNPNQADIKLISEFLAWQRTREQNLTIPPQTVHNPYCRDNNSQTPSEEGLCMIGTIRTKESCPVCHQPFSVFKQCQKCLAPPAQITQKKCSCGGDYKIVEVPIICPTCRTSPGTFYFDLFWKDSLGKTKRFKFYQDPQTGQEFDSWKACHRFAEHIRREMDNHGFDPSLYLKIDLEKYRFKNYAWAWFDRALPSLAPSTGIAWKGILKLYIVPWFGKSDIRKITNGDIADFLAGIKVGTYRKQNIITVLKRIYNNALERQDILTKPVFPTVKIEKSKHIWINRDDQAKVLSFLKEHYRSIVEFLMLTGMRPGEARALKKDCVFFQERVIIVKRTWSHTILRETTKDGDWRVIPMSRRVEEILRSETKKNIFTDFVFVNTFGKPYSNHLSTIWKEACQKAEVKITLYRGTKHSFLTQKLNQGHSLDELAAIAGHSSTYMTQVYAKMQVDSLRTVMEDEEKIVPRLCPQFGPGGN